MTTGIITNCVLVDNATNGAGSPVPLCKDCRFCVKKGALIERYWKCSCEKADSNQKMLPVNGKFDVDTFCVTQRNYDLAGRCGPAGRFFELAEQPKPIPIESEIVLTLPPAVRKQEAWWRLFFGLTKKS